MSSHTVRPLILFLIWPQRERLGKIFDLLEERGYEVLFHRPGKGSNGSDLAALYEPRDLRLLVYPSDMSDGSIYGITNDSFSYIHAVRAQDIPVMPVGMSLGGPFDDELEISGKPECVVARMLRLIDVAQLKTNNK